MYIFTVIGWLIFRETNIDKLLSYFTLNPFVSSQEQWVAVSVMVAMCVFTGLILISVLLIEKFVLPRIVDHWKLPFQSTAWSLCIVGIFLFVRMHLNDFIYFQF